jgi:hypothetical protein
MSLRDRLEKFRDEAKKRSLDSLEGENFDYKSAELCAVLDKVLSPPVRMTTVTLSGGVSADGKTD